MALHVSHSHTVLHPGCDISAHTRWPTVWLLLTGQPVVQRSQHGFQTLTWLILHCSHVHLQVHTDYIQAHTYTCHHIFTDDVILSWRVWERREREVIQIKYKKEKENRWWKVKYGSYWPLRTLLFPHLLLNFNFPFLCFHSLTYLCFYQKVIFFSSLKKKQKVISEKAALIFISFYGSQLSDNISFTDNQSECKVLVERLPVRHSKKKRRKHSMNLKLQQKPDTLI